MRHPDLLTTVMTLALLGAGACKAETAEEESAGTPAATTDTAVPAAVAMAPAGPATCRLRDLSRTATAEVTVDDAYPHGVASRHDRPSPDWFAAVTDVTLLENGAWVASMAKSRHFVKGRRRHAGGPRHLHSHVRRPATGRGCPRPFASGYIASR